MPKGFWAFGCRSCFPPLSLIHLDKEMRKQPNKEGETSHFTTNSVYARCTLQLFCVK